MPYDVGPAQLSRLRPRDLRQRRLSGRPAPRARDGGLRAAGARNAATARAAGRRLGVGVACYVELTGVGPFEGATIRADAAGRITVFTGVPSQGQGLETTLAQIAADELGVTPADVSIVGGDTLGIGQGVGTFASRAAVVGGTAVALAARELRAKAVRLAAQALGVAESEVEQRRQRASRGARAPSTGSSWPASPPGRRDGHRGARRGARAGGDALLPASRHRVLRRRARAARRGRCGDRTACGCAATG